MSDTYLGGARLPAISQEFIDTIDNAFPRPDVRPGMDRDTEMFAAGSRYVVEWIKAHAAVKSQPDPIAVQKAQVRYGT